MKGVLNPPYFLINSCRRYNKMKNNFINCRKCGERFSSWFKSCPSCNDNRRNKHSKVPKKIKKMKKELICGCGHTKEEHTLNGKVQVCFAHINPIDCGGIVIETVCPCKKFKLKKWIQK